MTTTGEENFAPANNGFLTTQNFELGLKKRLKWSNKEWSAAGESGTRLNKLCHSLNYWKYKLKPAIEDTSLIFTLYNVDRDVKFDFFRIITEIESLDTSVEVRGVSEFRNPRYLCVYFKNKEEKDIIESKFKLLEDCYVVYVSWALSPDLNVTTLKVHWLPLTLDINIIKKELEKYVSCVENIRVNIKFMSGREMPTGKITFKVNLKKDIKLEEIPHVAIISNMETLITISGRQPLCLNCNVLGHISRNCELRYCSTCKQMKSKRHDCVTDNGARSFAEVVMNREERLDPDDWGNEIFMKPMEQEVDEKVELNNKIKELEKKLQNSLKEDQEHVRARIEKKRKAYDSATVSNLKLMETEVTEQANTSAVNWASDQDTESDDEEILQEDNTTVKLPEPQNILKIENGEQAVEVFKTENQKKKKKKSSKQDNIQGNNSEVLLRSYGKPDYGNARRLSQQQKFDKLLNVREFVFKD